MWLCTNKKEKKKQKANISVHLGLSSVLKISTIIKNILKNWFTKAYFFNVAEISFHITMNVSWVNLLCSAAISLPCDSGGIKKAAMFHFHGLCCFCENRCERSVRYIFVWKEFLGLRHKSRFGSHAGRMFSIVNHGGQFWRASRSPALAHWGH